MITPIILTSKQKEELIALCNKTFPTVEFWWYVGTNILGYTDETEYSVKIHWFEFVVRMIIDGEQEYLQEFNAFFEKVQ